MLFWDIQRVQNSVLLKFYGPGICRNHPDVGNNIFMQCLHLLKQYFAPLPWRFLVQPELQQASDRFNCNQKHFLMLYAIKMNYIHINEQVVSIFPCNLRSDSELERRHLSPPHFNIRQALNITMIGLYYVQMWKLIVMLFLCDIFSGARGMLKSLCNHNSQREEMGDCRGPMLRKNSLSWSLNRLQLSLYQQASWTKSKSNYWRRKGLTEQ